MSTNTHDRARQPKGRPTGGQFAEEARAASGIALGAAADDEGARAVADAIEQLEAEEQVYPDATQNRSGAMEQLRQTPDDPAMQTYARWVLETAPALLPANPTWQPAQGVPRGEEMYSRSYGGRSLSVDGHYRTTAEVTKEIRADIKDAIAGGYLPGDLTYRVRKHDSATSSSVRIVAEGMGPHQFYDRRDAVTTYGDPYLQASPYVKEIEECLGKIAAQYNWDGSDTQSDYFDVNFYQHVEVANPLTTARNRAFALRDKAAKAHKAGDTEKAHQLLADLKQARREHDEVYELVEDIAHDLDAQPDRYYRP